MGVVTYIGPNSPTAVTQSNGTVVIVRAGIPTTLDDATCIGLLVTHSAWWLADDPHTSGLVPTAVLPVVTVTTPIVLQGGNSVVFANADSSGLFAVTLPDARTMSGKEFTIKNIGVTVNVTVNTSSGNTIEGASSYTLTPGLAIVALSDGTGTWRRLVTSGATPAPSTPNTGVLPETYGAIGDGIHDDTSAFTSAISAINSAGGGMLWLTPGKNYLVSSVTPCAGLYVEGNGATMTQKASQTSGLINLSRGASSVSPLTFENINFVGGASPGIFAAAVILNWVLDTVIRGCTFKNFLGGAIQLFDCQRVWVVDNDIRSCATGLGVTWNAIGVGPSSAWTGASPINDIVIERNYVDDCQSSCINVGTDIASVVTMQRIRISNNVVRTNAASQFATLSLENGGTTSMGLFKHITIENNVIENAGTSSSYAIEVVDDGGTESTDPTEFDYITIRGNNVKTTANGFNLWGSHYVVEGNNVEGGSGSVLVSGGNFRPSTWTIADNVFHFNNTVSTAVNLVNIDHLVFADNTFASDSGGGSTKPQLRFASCQWVDVHGNHLSYAGASAIYVDGSSDFWIHNNRIYNPNESNTGGEVGIWVFDTISGTVNLIADNIIVDDRVTHRMTYGVQIDGGSGTLGLRRNTIRGGLTAPTNGTFTPKSDNTYTTGAFEGRATLSSGTVTVSTTEVQANDNIILTRVSAGGTVGIPQVGTITAGTSFVINSVQPGTASTVQAADTSIIFWRIDH